MTPRIYFRLWASIWLIYVLHFNPVLPGSHRFVYLTRSLVEQHQIDVDPFWTRLLDLSVSDGHYYIAANPGLSFLAAPVWTIVYAAYRHLPETSVFRTETFHFVLCHFVGFIATTALFSSLAAVAVAWFVFVRTRERWRAILGAGLYAFGSITFYHSTGMNQNGVVACIGLCLFILMFEPRVWAGALDRKSGRVGKECRSRWSPYH